MSDADTLRPFFDPRGIAVVGASRDPGRVGGSILANLRSAGYAGNLVPVNPAAATLQGLRAVPSIADVPDPVDLAVIAVPAPGVLPALQACVARGIGGAVVISAGFRETGGEGPRREAELRRWLAGQPLRVLGPNCLGWIRPATRVNATFAPGMPLPGAIAFISHSGALAVAILDWSRERRMGFSLFASLGNQADLTETDLLRGAAADPETRVIVAYLEGVADGRRFFEALRAAAAVKPVAVLKTGRTPEGARAVSSHTGAIAGSDRAFDAAVRQAGAVRARTIEELFDLARALGAQPLPRGRRLVVVTNGGGLGIVATDAARDAGLAVSPLERPVQESLRAVLPPTASPVNPVDLVGDADAARFARALGALGEHRPADAVLVLLTAQAATESATVARAIIAGTRGWTIPVVAAFVGGARVAPGAMALEEAGLPCYPFPERAVGALAGMARLAERRGQRPEVIAASPVPAAARRQLDAIRSTGTVRPGLLELEPLLRAYGIDVAPVRFAASMHDAGTRALEIGLPVALKLVSPAITHKTEVGGVRLGLASVAEVEDAARAMLARVRAAAPDAEVQGLLVQSMVTGGHELLLGVVRDPQFGPLVLVGFGGIHVEVLQDTAARLAPIGPAGALAMLEELRMAPVLRGVRGAPPVDRQALAGVIARFARLATDLPELIEIEINPLVVGPARVVALDARATLG
jgi:acetyltransferase